MTLINPFVAASWGVHNNTYNNLVRAIHERVFCVEIDGVYQRPPLPIINVQQKLEQFRKKLMYHLIIPEPLSTEQFVDTYVGRKKKMYIKAAESLQLKPLELKDAFISAFIKDEKMMDASSKCPRIIQPRSPRFNVSIGVYIKALEKPIFRAIAGVFRGVTVAKGKNTFARGKLLRRAWDEFDDPVAIMVDASRCDQHCSSDIIGWEHMVMEKIFPDVRKLNDMRKINRCYARAPDGSVKYKVKGSRMSGDMDTSLGNVLTMCAITWTYLEELEIKYRYINDGDDGVVIVEKRSVECVRTSFKQYFLNFGFTMKWDGDTDVFEQINFCQCQPVYDGNRWRMVRTPKSVFAKDCVTLRRSLNESHLLGLANSTGWCGLALAGDLPVFCALYQWMVNDNKPVLDEYTTGMQYLAHGCYDRELSVIITDEARLSFWKAFNITPETQVTIEEYIQSISTPNFYKSPTPVHDFTINTTIALLINNNL